MLVVVADFRVALRAARDQGHPFEEAWPLALAHVGADLDEDADFESRSWHQVLSATRSSWRRAFEGSPPTRVDRLAVALANAVGDEPGDRERHRLVA